MSTVVARLSKLKTTFFDLFFFLEDALDVMHTGLESFNSMPKGETKMRRGFFEDRTDDFGDMNKLRSFFVGFQPGINQFSDVREGCITDGRTDGWNAKRAAEYN